MTAPATYKMPTTDVTDYGNRPNDGPLRVGGQGAPDSLMPRAANDLPSTPSPAAAKQQKALTVIRDVQGGTERLRECATTYLPQDPGEDAANYRNRLARAVFFNIFNHTTQALAGFVFRKDPVLGDDVPDEIEAHAENIDLAGSHLDVFLRERFGDALAAGHGGILVEFPKTDGQQTAADEGPDKIRPYWVPILKDNILSWRTTVERGHTLLSQLVLLESGYVADGAFGEREVKRYRVLSRTPGDPPTVAFQLLEVTKDDAVVVVDEGTYGNQVEIPFVEVTTSGKRGILESQPPLLDLAYLNIAHYQQYSDMANALHAANSPIYVETGTSDVDEDGNPRPIILGPNTARRFTSEHANAKYISHDGKAIDSSKQALDDLVGAMATLGVQMIVNARRAAETAQAKRIDKGSFDSSLAVAARGLQDAAERALDFHARYLKLDDGGSIKINRDFENMIMDSYLLQAYVMAVSTAGLPVHILLSAMQEGGLIAPDVDLDALELEMMANQAASDAKRAAELATLNGGMTPDGSASGGGAGADQTGGDGGAAPGPADSGPGEKPELKAAA